MAIEATGVASIAVEDFGPKAAELLAVVADPVRWRLLEHLARGQATCVCELQPIAGVAGNLLSYHLKVLREAHLVTTTRRGRWVDYTIAADALERLHASIPGQRPGPGEPQAGPATDRLGTAVTTTAAQP